MSKSKGTGMAPQQISDTLGAEILRLWVASGDYSGELTISNEILKRVVESYRRIRNTLRFLLANTSDFDPAKHSVPVAEMTEIDRYALALTARMQDGAKKDYEAYQFHLVTQKLQSFCSEDLGGFYLDILKDRLYTCGANSRARRSAQTALWQIAQALTRLMAPILSFTAEEAWKTFPGNAEKSVFEEIWHAIPDPDLDPPALEAWADRGKARSEGGRILARRRARHRGRRPCLRGAGAAGRRIALRADHLARDGEEGGGDRRQGQGQHASEVRTLLAFPSRRERGGPVRALREQLARRGRAAALCLSPSAGSACRPW
jgi:isoleucyl-tRNA synthetase